jgi:hypothetical protein
MKSDTASRFTPDNPHVIHFIVRQWGKWPQSIKACSLAQINLVSGFHLRSTARQCAVEAVISLQVLRTERSVHGDEHASSQVLGNAAGGSTPPEEAD